MKSILMVLVAMVVLMNVAVAGAPVENFRNFLDDDTINLGKKSVKCTILAYEAGEVFFTSKETEVESFKLNGVVSKSKVTSVDITPHLAVVTLKDKTCKVVRIAKFEKGEFSGTEEDKVTAYSVKVEDVVKVLFFDVEKATVKNDVKMGHNLNTLTLNVVNAMGDNLSYAEMENLVSDLRSKMEKDKSIDKWTSIWDEIVETKYVCNEFDPKSKIAKYAVAAQVVLEMEKGAVPVRYFSKEYVPVNSYNLVEGFVFAGRPVEGFDKIYERSVEKKYGDGKSKMVDGQYVKFFYKLKK